MNISELRQKIVDNSYFFLAVALTLFLILPPFAKDLRFLKSIIWIVIALVVVFCIVIITGRNKLKPIHWLLVIILLMTFYRPENLVYEVVSYLVFAIMFGWTALKIIKEILIMKEVNAHVMTGSVVAYLLMGISFSMMCAALTEFYPDAYNNPPTYDSFYNFVYFSFITITTLGYGDVVPQIPESQALAIAMTVSGQFYMVIIVATLVGKYLQKK